MAKTLPSAGMLPPDIMAKDSEDEMSWSSFRKLVNKNCGSYLKSKQAPDLRDEIHSILRRKYRDPEARSLDRFLDYLEDDHLNRMTR